MIDIYCLFTPPFWGLASASLLSLILLYDYERALFITYSTNKASHPLRLSLLMRNYVFCDVKFGVDCTMHASSITLRPSSSSSCYCLACRHVPTEYRRHRGLHKPQVLCSSIILAIVSYTEDLANVVSRSELSHHLYADDTQLLKRVRLTEIPPGIETLQSC